MNDPPSRRLSERRHQTRIPNFRSPTPPDSSDNVGSGAVPHLRNLCTDTGPGVEDGRKGSGVRDSLKEFRFGLRSVDLRGPFDRRSRTPVVFPPSTTVYSVSTMTVHDDRGPCGSDHSPEPRGVENRERRETTERYDCLSSFSVLEKERRRTPRGCRGRTCLRLSQR